MTRSIEPRLRAGELAYRLEQLCELGIGARSSGWCLGMLLPREIDWTGHGPSRAPSDSATTSRGARWRLLAHLRRGHDDWCRTIGIPRRALLRILLEQGPVDAVSLLEDALVEAVAELHGDPGWSARGAREAVAYAIRTRIIPVRPPLPIGEGEGRTRTADRDQMPRSASNWAASRRFFTWERKRAASAPSIVRWS